MRGTIAGSLGLSESSGKTSHTVSYSFSNSFSMSGDSGVVNVSLVSDGSCCQCLCWCWLRNFLQ